MTLTELKYIVAVARERHFGRAAEACHVSQPTLSVAIRKLEEELGVQLFERGSSEVSVTPTGVQIVEQAQRVLEQTNTIREIASQGRDPLAGPLRLGVIYTIGPYLLPKLVPLLRERAATMPLIIEENFTERLLEKLKNSELDVAVLALPFASGAVGSLQIAYALALHGGGYHNLAGYDTYASFVGRAGRLYWSNAAPRLHVESAHPDWAAAPFRELAYRLPESPAYGGAHGLAFLRDFISACRGGGDPPASGRDALQVARVVDAAYESSRSGRRVAVAGPA